MFPLTPLTETSMFTKDNVSYGKHMSHIAAEDDNYACISSAEPQYACISSAVPQPPLGK